MNTAILLLEIVEADSKTIEYSTSTECFGITSLTFCNNKNNTLIPGFNRTKRNIFP